MILQLGSGLRTENFEVVYPLMQRCADEECDDSFVDIVHDNAEIYPLAKRTLSNKPGVQRVRARSRGGPSVCPYEWSASRLRAVRSKSKIMLELWLFPGQKLLYEPAGNGGAKTERNWYLTKGEELVFVSYDPVKEESVVRCPNLNNTFAKITDEEVWVNLDNDEDSEEEKLGNAKLKGPPFRYEDKTTVYSGQVRAGRAVRVRVRASLKACQLLSTAMLANG